MVSPADGNPHRVVFAQVPADATPVEATFGDGSVTVDASLDLLDDPTGVAEAREQVADGGFEEEASSAEAIIEQLGVHVS